MLTIESLREYGANVDEGLVRCMNNEAFYLKMVGMLFDDQNIEKLKSALDAGDLNAAFEAAHALKGISTNLSLTPLSEPVIEMTELLRARTEMDYGPLMQNVQEQYDKLSEMRLG